MPKLLELYPLPSAARGTVAGKFQPLVGSDIALKRSPFARRFAGIRLYNAGYSLLARTKATVKQQPNGNDPPMTAEEQARALVREARAERPLSLPWVDSVVDAYVWRFGPGATAARQRDLLIALQELAGQLDPLQYAILKGRIAVF
jgi:hypothetical protein